MSPHAVPPESACPLTNHACYPPDNLTNGVHEPRVASHEARSDLTESSEEELHDLICIGFGPASLAIAIALHDGLEGLDKSLIAHKLNGRRPKTLFLEKQIHFAWHPGMLIEGARMQINFIKDMATLRNPRSRFTFLNYLHEKGRLVEFTNLDTFLPQRAEFEDYLKWCAGAFDDVVIYGEEVLDVQPYGWGTKRNLPVNSWVVSSQNRRTGRISARRTRNIVVAVGGQPSIPRPFEEHPRVVHSSQYMYKMFGILPDRNGAYNIAVIGSGQSAAEVFDDLQSQYPNATTTLMIRGPALRPSDDSPFVNEIFDPARVTPFFFSAKPWQQHVITENRPTNYGVVRGNLLMKIYERLYMQRIYYGNDESTWPHKILVNANVTGFSATNNASKICLRVSQCLPGCKLARSKQDLEDSASDCMLEKEHPFDAVVLGTGYTRDAHKLLLRSLDTLKPQGANGKVDDWSVRRDYSIEFAEGTVAQGCGIWLQGCCEDSHGLADSLLSILAVRGGEIVSSIFGLDATSKGCHHHEVVSGSVDAKKKDL